VVSKRLLDSGGGKQTMPNKHAVDTKKIGVWIHETDKKWLQIMAKEKGSTVSDVLRYLIEDYLEGKTNVPIKFKNEFN
jgi:hypothetical protein